MDKGFKNQILRDDETSYGGISHVDETLGDFCKSGGIDIEKTSLKEMNIMLRECGICPLFEDEKMDFACLIAYYLGQKDMYGLCDSLSVLGKITSYVNDYEFIADENGDISPYDVYDDALLISNKIFKEAKNE